MHDKPTQKYLLIIMENKWKSHYLLKLMHTQRVAKIEHNNSSTKCWWRCWYLEFWYIHGGILKMLRWLSKADWEFLWRVKYIWSLIPGNFSPECILKWVERTCPYKYVNIHCNFIQNCPQLETLSPPVGTPVTCGFEVWSCSQLWPLLICFLSFEKQFSPDFISGNFYCYSFEISDLFFSTM